MSDSKSFPLFEARGTPRELGRQHGAQAAAQVRGFLDFIAAMLKLSRSELRSRALRFLPLFETHCPHLVEEIRGLAEGAAVDFADALALQMRAELGQLPGEACTTFVIAARGTAGGGILIGQNSDMDPEYEQYGYMLRLVPSPREGEGGEPSAAILMWTFGGQLGYHGLNAHGVAHFANALGGGPPWKFGLSHYPIKRMMLEQRTIGEVRLVLHHVPVCSNGNYVVCDGQGRIGDIELTPSGFAFVENERFLVHTNHFLCGKHACAANHNVSVPDSFPRLERARQLVGEMFGHITVDDMKHVLADHAGFPTSICRHPHDGPDHPSVSARGYTAASLIAEPARGLIHVCRGNPCTGTFATCELQSGS